MIHDKMKENSIAPIGSNGLGRIGNSIDLTKKIISQGSVSERNFLKVYVIPFRKEEGYYLYDRRTNLLGKGPYKSISRNREFFICLDYGKKYWVLKNDEILFQFAGLARNDLTFFPPEFAPPFKIIENKYIVIFYYRPIYGRKYIEGYRIVIEGVFDFEGNKIEYPLSENELEAIINHESKDDLKISETLWETKGTTLKFKNNVILNIEDNLEIYVSDFHCGYAEVSAVENDDPEIGEMLSDIGYIDVYGNIYWQPGLKYGWDRADKLVNDKNEPSIEIDLPF